jgi:hypothetical protein
MWSLEQDEKQNVIGSLNYAKKWAQDFEHNPDEQPSTAYQLDLLIYFAEDWLYLIAHQKKLGKPIDFDEILRTLDTYRTVTIPEAQQQDAIEKSSLVIGE